MKNYLLFVLAIVLSLSLISCSRGNDSVADSGSNSGSSAPNNIVVTLKGTKDIFPTWAKFQGNITQTYNNLFTVGFVYSTTPNPTATTGTVVSDYKSGTTDFNLNSMSLTYNTTYYVRAFAKASDGTYIYSAESTFKTTGYYGPAGGYVAYDKGETTNGWRYMEIHPTTVNFNSSGVGGNWGTVNMFISGTYTDFGKGQENTTIIVNNEPAANCAAKLCDNLVRNGFSDWYLPSSEELITMNLELKKANISIPNNAWSSSQYTAIEAYTIYTSISNPSTPLIGTISKGMAYNILPARRY